MKLEYLADGAADCPLLRLYGFNPIEAGQLRDALVELAAGRIERVEVHKLPWIAPVGECRLTLVRRSWDQAVVRISGPTTFECGFTAATWNNVAALVEPFMRDGSGFQWLAESPGEANLLLSVAGGW